jgi:hypothetical protein
MPDFAETMLIRVWMKTAVRKEVTSFGTFLSTLCHEFFHHLDFQRFGFSDSWHTRGFYERAAALYHWARGTPPKRLLWVAVRGGRWRIDWRAFQETYGLPLKAVLSDEDKVLSSYRRAVSKQIPKATRIAWTLKKDEIQKDAPGITRKKFLYNLSRASYEKQ